MATTGELLFYKCMTPKYLEGFVSDLIDGGSDDIELKINPSGTEYKRLLHIPLLPQCFSYKGRENLTIAINVAAVGPKPSFYDPLSVCISDRDMAMGIQLRDPSEYTDPKLGPYMSMYGKDGFSLSEVDNQPSAEHEKNFQYETWRRWPQMFNMRIKPSPGSEQPWGLCSSSVNGGISLSFTYPNSLRVYNALDLVLYRYKSTESYTITMIEVSIYNDAPDQKPS